MSKSREIIKEVSSSLLNDISEGLFPWEQPDLTPFINFATGGYYSGFNTYIMYCYGAGNFRDKFFIGFHQARSLGLKLFKGSRGMPVLVPIFRNIKKKDLSDEEFAESEQETEGKHFIKVQLFLKKTIFNISQFSNANKFMDGLGRPAVGSADLLSFMDCPSIFLYAGSV